jgi:hypothetical protein
MSGRAKLTADIASGAIMLLTIMLSTILPSIDDSAVNIEAPK